jgi:hypothetical protein
MAKNLGAAILGLMGNEKVELRAAATTVLAAVGGGDPQVIEALTGRLADPDAVVRRLALDGLAAMKATGIAAKLVPLLREGDGALAERAAELLGAQGAAAEAVLRRELPTGTVQARRAIAGLLLGRGTTASLDAVLDQLADAEVGEQMLQLLRAELDRGNDKVAAHLEKVSVERAGELGKQLRKEWARAVKDAAAAVAAATPKRTKGKKPAAASAELAPLPAPPAMDPAVVKAIAHLGLLLRLIGYQARPSALALLIAHASADHPRAVRLASIAAMRRVVASSEAKGTDKAIEVLIALAGGDDLAVAQAAIDTLRGARIPERLARPFAQLARAKNPAAQKLAMERLPAGGGAGAVRALVDALGGADPTARDAAARGLAKAPEAVLPLARALVAATDADIARRYATALRQHRAHVSTTALGEIGDAAAARLEQHAKGKAGADSILLERVLMETLADLEPRRHVELLFDYARRLRKAGKPGEAFAALRPLLRSHADLDAAIDDDRRFTLAMLGLVSLGQGILRATGTDAPVLEQFARLAIKGYPVARKLAREKDVGDEDIYALGFRMCESKDDEDQDLGIQLLEGLIEERPRSKLAKNAKNKLRLIEQAN